MKILNKNKIIVSALALAIGASLAGSISGTIAWYQYSTRANVSFIGEASGFSGNLQMRFASESANDSAWRTRITWQQMNAELANDHYAEKVVPMTYGALGKDEALPADGYIQPLAGVASMQKWTKATKKNYAQFTLQLREQERENGQAENVQKPVYLTKVLIQEDAKSAADGKGDLSNAVRVHIKATDASDTKYRLISNLGKDIETKGKLDLDNDGEDDQAYLDGDEFGFSYTDNTYANRDALEDVVYGDDGDASTREIQSSYNVNTAKGTDGMKWTQEEIDAAVDGDPAFGKTTDDWKEEPNNQLVVYSENNILHDNNTKDGYPTINKEIGKTIAGDSNYLTVQVTIWVEGWQKLDGKAIWDADYIDSSFNVGIQFGVQDYSVL